MRNLARHGLIYTFFIALSVFAAGDLRGQEDKPRAVVSAFQDELLTTMKQAKVLSFEDRYQQLLPAMERAFDFHEITRIAVGPNWIKMPETEQRQVVDLFRRFSVSTYASAFSSYEGEQFEIGEARAQSGLGTIVETRLTPKHETSIEIDYLLRDTPDGWKIVDVYLAGTISELARRRAEFSSIIRKQGVVGLIDTLKRKNAELAALRKE